jgi:hypothetical protein
VAYTGLGGPIPEFLQRMSEPGPADVKSSVLEYAPPSLTSKSASPAIGFKEAIS